MSSQVNINKNTRTLPLETIELECLLFIGVIKSLNEIGKYNLA